MIRLVVVAALLCASGCATFQGAHNDLLELRDDLDLAKAGVAAACPEGRNTDLCTISRHLYDATEQSYRTAVVGFESGKNAEPFIRNTWTAISALWTALQSLFASDEQTHSAPPVTVVTPVPASVAAAAGGD